MKYLCPDNTLSPLLSGPHIYPEEEKRDGETTLRVPRTRHSKHSGAFTVLYLLRNIYPFHRDQVLPLT